MEGHEPRVFVNHLTDAILCVFYLLVGITVACVFCLLRSDGATRGGAVYELCEDVVVCGGMAWGLKVVVVGMAKLVGIGGLMGGNIGVGAKRFELGSS